MVDTKGLIEVLFPKRIVKQQIQLKKIIDKEKEILKNIDKLNKIYHDKKLDIYKEVKENLIKENKLICLSGNDLTIDLSKNKKNIIDKITSLISKQKPIETDYKVLYLGYGNNIKLIDIPKIEGSIVNSANTKELHVLTKESTDKKPYFMNGKRVIWLSKDCIFNPEFDDKDKKFVWDIKPNYFFNLINYVMDWSLTKPKTEKVGLLETIKKYWIIIALVVGLYILNKSGGQ